VNQRGQVFLIVLLIAAAIGGYLVYTNYSNNRTEIIQPRPLPVSEAEGRFCGGIAANLPENQCPEGYKCQLDGNYPDAGGKCVKK